jgi:endonuclease G
VLVVLPVGSDDVSRVSAATRVIAVKMPNTQTVDTKPWHSYRVSVDSLETLTGYNFLSNVPAAVQSAIEAVVDSVAP